MGQSQLDEFFREKKQKAQPPGIDWTAKRDAWSGAVSALYDTIERDDLATAKDSVSVDRSQTKPVSEAFVGEYTIHELGLAVGDEPVVFSPIRASMWRALLVAPMSGEIGARRPSCVSRVIAGCSLPRGRRRSGSCRSPRRAFLSCCGA